MTDTRGWPLRIAGVSKHYGAVRALADVDLSVGPGEFLTILGPSGSGKTTMLKCVAGFEDIEAGGILLGDADITDQSPAARNIGMVFQSYALFPHMTVEQNVAFPLAMRRMAKADIAARVSEALRMTELEKFGRRYPRQLSGGQQQRVALARAVVFEPRLLLLDEPFGALDRKLRETMQLEVRRLQQSLDLTTVFITHDQDEALMMSDRIAVMFDGALHQVGRPEDIYERPASARVAEFVGESNLLKGTVSAAAAAGHVAVDIGGGRTVLAQSAGREPAQGANVTVLVRPERLAPLAGAAGPHANAMRVSVREAIYLGNVNRYRLASPGGRDLLMRLPSSAPKLDVGEALDVGFDPAAARLVAGDAADIAGAAA